MPIFRDDHDAIIDFVVCNPPFHENDRFLQAKEANRVRYKNADEDGFSYGGIKTELVTVGGEVGFMERMV